MQENSNLAHENLQEENLVQLIIRYLQVLVIHKWIFLFIFALIFTCIIIFAFKQPKEYKSEYEVFYNETVHEYMSEKDVPVVKSDFDKNFWFSKMQSSEILHLTLNRTGLPLTETELKSQINIEILDKKKEDRIPIFKVGIKSGHPGNIPIIMTAYIESLNELLFMHQQNNSQRLIAFLTDQLAKNNEKLNSIDKQVITLASVHSGGIQDAEKLQTNLELFRMDLMKAEITLNTLKASRQRAETSLKNLDGTIINESAFTEPVKVQLMNLEVDLARALTRNREDHPSIKAIRSNIKQLNEMLRDSLENRMQIKSLMENPLKTQLMSKLMELQIEEVSEETHVASLKRVIGDLEHQILPDSSDENQQQVLRNREMVFLTIKQLNSNLIEAQSASSGSLSRFVIADEPSVPNVPANKSILFFIAVGLLVGLTVAAVVVYLYDLLDNRLIVAADYERFYSWPVLGSLGVLKQGAPNINGPGEPTTGYDSRSDLNNLVINIKQALKYKDKRVLSVCSSVRHEGKTHICLEIARALAHKKLRVLLVDTDFFSPKLSKMLNKLDESGLSNLISGDCTLEGVEHETQVPLLWITPAGTVTDSRDLFYDSPVLGQYLKDVKDRFDVVIVDTPATLFIPEILSFMEHVDGTILVVRLGNTSRVALNKLKRLFELHNLFIIGTIINGVKENVLSKYSGYHYENYQYVPEREKPAVPRNLALEKEQGRTSALLQFGFKKWGYYVLTFLAVVIAACVWYLSPEPKLAAKNQIVDKTGLIQLPITEHTEVSAPDTVKRDSALVAQKEPLWLDTVVIEPGTRLTLLSLSYYGNKSFWVYIYMENRDVIENPNYIPVGTSIKIPFPEKYAIDASSKTSLDQAVLLQTKILAAETRDENKDLVTN